MTSNNTDATRPTPEIAADTLPAWLAHRFDPRGPDWDNRSDDDQAYWAHEAAAVRRAVTRVKDGSEWRHQEHCNPHITGACACTPEDASTTTGGAQR